MVAHDLSSLIYICDFPLSHGDFVVHHLFGNSQNSGYFPQAALPIEWDYPCEFPCFKYEEPLECVQARRIAFGGSVARITADGARHSRRIRISAGIELGDRFLVFAKPHQAMQSYRDVSIRWAASGVLDVPRFCISTALNDQHRIEWGIEPHSMDLLRAALTLKPTAFDVFGFYTADERMFGAVEFSSTRIGELYQVRVFCTPSDRRLMVGDELWGWYTGNIGEAHLQANRLLAVVERVPDTTVPMLNRGTFG